MVEVRVQELQLVPELLLELLLERMWEWTPVPVLMQVFRSVSALEQLRQLVGRREDFPRQEQPQPWW